MSTTLSRPDEIVGLLRRRDESGIRSVFENYGPALNGVIVRIVKDQRISEEVLQDALVKIWNKIELYDAKQSGLFTWMMGIARNTAIDRVRLKGFQVTQKSESFDAPVHDNRVDEISTASVDIDKLTEGMDPKYLDVLQKMYLEGYSTSAAAEALNLPLGTVKTRLRTALTMLREKVKTDKTILLGSVILSILANLLWTFL